jgi:hypothetical protein
LEVIRRIGAAGIVPPLTFELVLRDKRSFFLHSVTQSGEGSTLALRVWDLRDLDDADFGQLKENLDRRGGQPIGNPQDLHPKLGLGILRLNIHDLAYHVEWHPRWWPLPEDGSRPAGQAPFTRVEPFRRRDRQGRD